MIVYLNCYNITLCNNITFISQGIKWAQIKIYLVKLNQAGFRLNRQMASQRSITYKLKKVQIVTLIGPNGSGKSTTAKIALGIYKKIDGSG